MDFKKWMTIGVIALAIIAEVALVFLNPIASVFTAMSFILGGVAGYFIKKDNAVTIKVPVKKQVEKQTKKPAYKKPAIKEKTNK